MNREATRLFWLHCLLWAAFCAIYVGCGKPQDALDKAAKTIDSFEEVEKEVMEIEKSVRERDARERLYHHFYGERDEILDIAEGRYNQNNPLHRALVREMSWLVLAELKDRRPDFQLRVEREHPQEQQDESDGSTTEIR